MKSHCSSTVPLRKDLGTSLLLPCRNTFLLSHGFANSQGNIFSVGETLRIYTEVSPTGEKQNITSFLISQLFHF